jgi:hypothetical protein
MAVRKSGALSAHKWVSLTAARSIYVQSLHVDEPTVAHPKDQRTGIKSEISSHFLVGRAGLEPATPCVSCPYFLFTGAF